MHYTSSRFTYLFAKMNDRGWEKNIGRVIIRRPDALRELQPYVVCPFVRRSVTLVYCGLGLYYLESRLYSLHEY